MAILKKAKPRKKGPPLQSKKGGKAEPAMNHVRLRRSRNFCRIEPITLPSITLSFLPSSLIL